MTSDPSNRDKDAPDFADPIESFPNSGSSSTRLELSETRRLQKARLLLIANAVFTAGIMVFFFIFGLRLGAWQLFALTGVEILALAGLSISFLMIRRRKLVAALSWVIGSSQLCLLASVAFLAGTGPFLVLSSILLIIIFTSAFLEGAQSIRFLVAGVIVGFLAIAFNTLDLFNLESARLALPTMNLAAGLLFTFLILAFIVLVITKFVNLSIQTKLLTGFLVVSLIPLTVIAIFYATLTTRTLTYEASQSLTIAANQTANLVETSIIDHINGIRSEALIPSLANYLSLAPEKRPGSLAESNVNLTLRTLLSKDQANLISYAILDLNGKSIFDTDARSLGRDESYYPYFKAALEEQFQGYNPLFFDPYTGLAQVIFAAPVIDNHGDLAGVLRARYKSNFFLLRLTTYVNMVQKGSYPILFDENQIRLADPLDSNNQFKSLIPLPAAQLQKLQNDQRMPRIPAAELSANFPAFSAQLNKADSEPFFLTAIFNDQTSYAGAIAKLKSLPWSVVYIQNQNVLLAPVNAQTNLSILVIGFIGLLGGLLAILLATVLSRPIVYLTQAAQRISSGDLQTQVVIQTGDEIETLGQAFNLMTSQVRNLISGLEDRVQKRTQELALQTQRMTYRAAQLQTVADVARAIASIQDLEQLLHIVTRLTSERFNFYHVGIFLIDENGEYAVLRAANSEGGQRMLARQHRLKVGQSSSGQEPTSIVGFVTSTGQPRIATEVGKDSSYFNNPELPLTRSEMTLPLKGGEKVIGALDVQSVISHAFSDEDVNLFSILADQIGIAIVNNRLYAETRQALNEAQAIHRTYLRQEWTREITQRRYPGYQYTQKGVRPIEVQSTLEIEKALQTGEIYLDTTTRSEDKPHSALAVPVKLRGEIIGVINLQETESNRQWTPEEIAMAQSVADQIGIALENARLFEQTVRRAEREQKVLEITSKIRATNDPKLMLQTAITELQQVLKANKAQILFQTQPGSTTNQEGQDGQITDEERSTQKDVSAPTAIFPLTGNNGIKKDSSNGVK